MKVLYIAQRHGIAPRGLRRWIAQALRLIASDIDAGFSVCVYGLHEEDRPGLGALVAQFFAWKLTMAAEADAELERVVAEHNQPTEF